ncbi:Sjogren's syndrome/scleroderma autoantigen 1 family protein [Methanosphaerula palustris]|uniref:Sjogrens syndrome scleroderma autoantigen 1 n=1 Tax=Methanosphaerula palustris (strain ATCC BAA-1556 / DSM 19958 / E1-9c) TaxID=521011 RepID=B8GH01_METPE|nr:Sjogren's syndrome/scleroderma autoantigen 1 family protein [Methanosphaerula palustris]ACL16406.1 Sjogrens syndrome scleroderma autoantigen 1 [Methanosphaerula palustris E1-9c]
MPAKADEIMAEYLLRGGKMLSKGCRVCGSPLFCIKGEECCVVCAEEEKQQREKASQPVLEPERLLTMPALESVKSQDLSVVGTVERNLVAEELQATVVNLCRRVQGEPDPERCAVLLDCVRTAVLTLNELR